MRGDETEALVEAPRVDAARVAGQLHERAAETAGLLDRPRDELGAEAARALTPRDAYALDDGRVAPRRESPGTTLSCSVPTTRPSRSATTRCWAGSAATRSYAVAYVSGSPGSSRPAPSGSSASRATMAGRSARVAGRITHWLMRSRPCARVGRRALGRGCGSSSRPWPDPATHLGPSRGPTSLTRLDGLLNLSLIGKQLPSNERRRMTRARTSHYTPAMSRMSSLLAPTGSAA